MELCHLKAFTLGALILQKHVQHSVTCSCTLYTGISTQSKQLTSHYVIATAVIVVFINVFARVNLYCSDHCMTVQFYFFCFVRVAAVFQESESRWIHLLQVAQLAAVTMGKTKIKLLVSF